MHRNSILVHLVLFQAICKTFLNKNGGMLRTVAGISNGNLFDKLSTHIYKLKGNKKLIDINLNTFRGIV